MYMLDHISVYVHVCEDAPMGRFFWYDIFPDDIFSEVYSWAFHNASPCFHVQSVDFLQTDLVDPQRAAFDAGHFVRIVIDEDDLKKKTKIQGEGPWAQAAGPFDPFDPPKRQKKTSWLPCDWVICEEREREREREREGKKEKGA